MPKIIHQRTGAPFALVKDQALPANISTSYGDVSTEIAVVNGFTTAVSGTNTIAPAEPASAKQVLRWHFLTTQSGVGPSSYFTDFGPDGKRGIATSLDNVNASWAAMVYGTHNAQANGAYGASFYGDNSETRRVVSDPLDKLTGADTIRVVMVVQPRTWTNQPESLLCEFMSGTGGQMGSSSITTCRPREVRRSCHPHLERRAGPVNVTNQQAARSSRRVISVGRWQAGHADRRLGICAFKQQAAWCSGVVEIPSKRFSPTRRIRRRSGCRHFNASNRLSARNLDTLRRGRTVTNRRRGECRIDRATKARADPDAVGR